MTSDGTCDEQLQVGIFHGDIHWTSHHTAGYGYCGERLMKKPHIPCFIYTHKAEEHSVMTGAYGLASASIGVGMHLVAAVVTAVGYGYVAIITRSPQQCEITE